MQKIFYTKVDERDLAQAAGYKHELTVPFTLHGSGERCYQTLSMDDNELEALYKVIGDALGKSDLQNENTQLKQEVSGLEDKLSELEERFANLMKQHSDRGCRVGRKREWIVDSKGGQACKDAYRVDTPEEAQRIHIS